MTSLAIAKLACDALLFGSLLFLSFRLIKRQPNNATNLLKLKELEVALKEVVKEADQASQSFNNELLSRKRDLENTLGDAQAIEGRINKSSSQTSEAIREAELVKRDLESITQRSVLVLQQQQALIEKTNSRNQEELAERIQAQQAQAAASRYLEEARIQAEKLPEPALVNRFQTESIPQLTTNSAPKVSRGREIIPPAPSANFEYDKMLEPPSFSQLSEVTEKRVLASSPQKFSLSEKIVRETDQDRSKNLKPVQHSSQIEDSLLGVASAAERSINATNSKVPEHLEDVLNSIERDQRSGRREDPRLGVLGGLRRGSQVL